MGGNKLHLIILLIVILTTSLGEGYLLGSRKTKRRGCYRRPGVISNGARIGFHSPAKVQHASINSHGKRPGPKTTTHSTHDCQHVLSVPDDNSQILTHEPPIESNISQQVKPDLSLAMQTHDMLAAETSSQPHNPFLPVTANNLQHGKHEETPVNRVLPVKDQDSKIVTPQLEVKAENPQNVNITEPVTDKETQTVVSNILMDLTTHQETSSILTNNLTLKAVDSKEPVTDKGTQTTIPSPPVKVQGTQNDSQNLRVTNKDSQPVVSNTSMKALIPQSASNKQLVPDKAIKPTISSRPMKVQASQTMTHKLSVANNGGIQQAGSKLPAKTQMTQNVGQKLQASDNMSQPVIPSSQVNLQGPANGTNNGSQTKLPSYIPQTMGTMTPGKTQNTQSVSQKLPIADKSTQPKVQSFQTKLQSPTNVEEKFMVTNNESQSVSTMSPGKTQITKTVSQKLPVADKSTQTEFQNSQPKLQSSTNVEEKLVVTNNGSQVKPPNNASLSVSPKSPDKSQSTQNVSQKPPVSNKRPQQVIAEPSVKSQNTQNGSIQLADTAHRKEQERPAGVLDHGSEL